jgi:endonuclease YncB( thermonuclease family)
MLIAARVPARAGDSMYGKVTAVRTADLVVLEQGKTQYQVRIIGVDVPKAGAAAEQARLFVSNLVMGRNARMRFDHRNEKGEMVAILLTDDPKLGIRDVGIELLRVGLAQKQRDFDYKYGEMARAQAEAQRARRGIWSQGQQPK